MGEQITKINCHSSCLSLSDVKTLSKLTTSFNINNDGDSQTNIDFEKMK